MSIVRDMELWPSGEQKISWVRRYMPLLNHLEAQFETEKPFLGKRIAVSVHMEAKTAYLCQVLARGGAEVRATGSNPLSTQDDVAAALARSGVEVFAVHGCTGKEYEEHLRRTLEFAPHAIVDDGGDLVQLLHGNSALSRNLAGGCEETTTGVLRLKARERAGELFFPMISVNDADCKHLFDNRYGTGQSVWDGIMRSTNLIVAGKTVVVAGYGWCGKGVSQKAKGLGARVIVTEVNPVKAIEAVMDGFTVMSMDEAAALGDVFVTVTGCKDVIVGRHFDAMKDGVLLANAGHFDVEIAKPDLLARAQEVLPMKPNIEGYRMKDGRVLNLMAEGRLVNLASGDGHPAEIMDMSFALQALSVKYILENAGNLDNRVYPVPRAVDRYVASEKLAAMGISIDRWSDEQREYVGGWQV